MLTKRKLFVSLNGNEVWTLEVGDEELSILYVFNPERLAGRHSYFLSDIFDVHALPSKYRPSGWPEKNQDCWDKGLHIVAITAALADGYNFERASIC